MHFVGRALVCLVGLSTMPALAVSPNSLPMELRKQIVGLNNDCRGFGGTPGKSPDLVKFGDLNADGLTDYVVDLNAYDCQGAASAMGAGQSGAAVTIYVGGPNNTARQVYNGLSFGAKVESVDGKSKLYLDVSGVNCGQRNAAKLPMVDLKACSRPMVWNEAKKSFVFAPLSQAKPMQ